MRCRVRVLVGMFACLGMSLLLGCGGGPKLVPVSGQVLVDGKPLETGFIQVIPADERPAGGVIGSDGRFTLTTYETNDGCALGTHQVIVTATKQLNAMATEHLVPPDYGDPAKSSLKTTVDGPTKELKIELTWNGGKPYIEQVMTGGDVAPTVGE